MHETVKSEKVLMDGHDVTPVGRAIGEDVCALFCSYEETDRIHEFLGTGAQ